MTCALAAIVLLQASVFQGDPKLAAHSHVHLRAQRLPAQLKVLAKDWGVKLSCSSEFDETMLVVAVTDRSRADILVRIAEASHGRWVKGDGYTLRRVPIPPENSLQAMRTKLVQEALDKRLAEMAKHPMDEPTLEVAIAQVLAREAAPQRAQTEDEAEVHINPTTRLGTRLLSRIGAERLASIASNKRVVFATDPTPQQESLPDEFEQDWATFLKELHAFDRAASPHATQLVDLAGDWVAQWRNRALAAKVLLAVSSSEVWNGRAPGLRAELALYSSQGVGLGAVQLPIDDWVQAPYRSEQVLKGDASTVIRLGEVAEHVVRTINRRRSNAVPLRAPEQIASLLADPVEHPPLSFGFTDGTFTIAADIDLDTVLCPRRGLAWPEVVQSLQVTPRTGAFLDRVANDPLTETWEDEGWWIARELDPDADPVDPGENEGARRFLRHVLDRSVSVRDQLELAAARGDAAIATMAIDPEYATLNPGIAQVDDAVLQFAGTLLPEQLDRLEQLGVVHLDSLSAKQRQLLLDLPSYDGSPLPEQLRKERTQRALDHATVTLKAKPWYAALYSDPGSQFERRPARPEQLARSFFSRDSERPPGTLRWAGSYYLLSGTEWSVSVECGGDEPLVSVFTLGTTRSAEPMPIEKFPKAFLDRFREHLKELEG